MKYTLAVAALLGLYTVKAQTVSETVDTSGEFVEDTDLEA